MSQPPLFRPNQPFDVKRWPGHYSWVILFFGTLGMIAAVPGSPPGMSVFVDDMIAALDLSRSQFALAYTFGTVAAGLFAPIAGRLVDVYGTRIMGCFSFFSLGLVLIFTGNVGPLYRWIAVSISADWLPFFLVVFAFAGMRLMGVSFAMTTCRSMVFQWFDAKRGWAAAINGTVLSLSFSSAPLVLNSLVLGVGWESAWIYLGLLFATVMTALAYVFFRDTPESCGIELERAACEDARKTRVPIVRDFTGPEAIRTGVFWIFVAGLAVNAMIGTGVSFHIVAIGAAQGVDRMTTVGVFLPTAIFHITTTLLLGAVVERMKLKYVLMIMVFAQTVALYGIANFHDSMWRMCYIVGSGIGWGAFGILINVPWGRFFGRKHLGAINGWVTGATVITSALGPYLFGLSNELSGSFLGALVFCLFFCPIVLLFAAIADNPQAGIQK